MTEKIFYNDQYVTEWDAKVEEVIEEDGKFIVVLDKTAFYPEGGGQTCDKGYIDGKEVTYVYEKDNVVYHVAKEAPKGEIVSCKLDYNLRLDHMQQHAGEHLLSGVLYKLYNSQNNGFHMGDEYVTIDASIKNMDDSIIDKVEQLANEYIYKNVDVKTYFVKEEELKNLKLRKECKVHGNIRIVEIDDIDTIACCGTHVRKTGEIGLIKIIKTENYKGMTRIYFKCGMRALSDYKNKHNIIANLCKHYSATEHEIFLRAENDSKQIKEFTKEIKSLKEKVCGYEADSIIKNASSNLIVKNYEDKDFSDIKLIGKKVTEKGKYGIVFISIKDKKILFGYNDSCNVNCGKVFKENLSKFNGKGGGGSNQAQASFINEDDLIRFSEFLKGEVVENII